MNQEQENRKLQRAEEFLRIIERTRLLYNTSAELGEVVGFSLESGNGLTRKGGRSAFMKDAILRELIFMTGERTSLDLERVIEAYVEADDIMQNYKSDLRGKDVCRHFIRHFFADGEVTKKLETVVGKLQRQHIPLLVLMLEGALPPLSAKGGDVASIAEDYRRVFAMLRRIVCSDIFLRTLPMMTEMEVWANKNPKKLCRIDLIDCVNAILEAYGRISTPAHLSRTNVEQLSRQFFPDLEGIWTEDEASTVFWSFEEIDNGHRMRRFVLNTERKELTYTEYYLRCFDEGDGKWAMITHPSLIRYIVRQSPIPSSYFASLEMTQDEDGALTFSPLTEDSRWFHQRRLKRSCREAFLQNLLADRSYRQVDNFPEDEYTFTLSLAAITEDALYVGQDDGSYLCVPKSLDTLLSDVCFGESVGIIRLKKGLGRHKDAEAVYLAFDDRRLYYEVTTARQRKALGIEVVDRIG